MVLGYAAMSFPDVLGVVAERLRLEDFASIAVFVWFAVVSLPSGVLCGRIGSRKAAVLSLGVSILGVALLAFGGERSLMAVAGLAAGGAANVLLQVAMPAHIAELFDADRQTGVLTVGQFAKTFMAIALPFVLAGCAAMGNWRLFFLAFGALMAVAALVLALPGGDDAERPAERTTFKSAVALLRDTPTALVVSVFAIAVMSDVAFNLSVPGAVRGRFMAGDSTVGAVYAVLFGVKLPVMLFGAWLFGRFGTARFFAPSIAVALAGAATMLLAGGLAAYLAGVALFAAGYANMYAYVFGAASPRHPKGRAAAVSALIAMAIAGGAFASPVLAAIAPLGGRSAEALVVASVATMFVLVSAAGRLSGRRG